LFGNYYTARAFVILVLGPLHGHFFYFYKYFLKKIPGVFISKNNILGRISFPSVVKLPCRHARWRDKVATMASQLTWPASLPRHPTWRGKGGYRHAARPPLVSPALLLPRAAPPLRVHIEETKE
jgi:hypothetical protein